MDGREEGVTAGLFATVAQAQAAAARLHRIGFGDGEIEVGRPAPGRYRLDFHEAASLGKAALDGIVVGTIAGGAIGAIFLTVAVPAMLEYGTGAIVLGVLVGAFWGSFFGGLGGMAIQSLQHGEGVRWCEIPEGNGAALVIAHAGTRVSDARKALVRSGGQTILAPSIAPTPDGAPALAASSANGATAAGAHLAERVGVPRGAFLLLIAFLVAVSALWANVYLRVVWRA